MIYLVGQMFFFLVFAALLGLAVGWFIGETARKRLATQLLQVQEDLTCRDNRLRQCQSDNLALERQVALAQLVADSEDEEDQKNEANSSLAVEAASDDAQDDLQRIYGIGAVLERRLNELGITTYKQIMALSPADIASLSDKLGIFPGRIEHDGWLASAAKEQAKKT